ncbi:polyprenyl synthetase family protein [uncultured Limosilactobacillus sp.]|uniref:polyprenyl synthetase family protein n=1 Tax=uncultured Limosilactobacillus sp. TaxID=2837629 RepID=UPI0025E1FC5B|nr:polyprenyl synthetase family protein [uncultured Limosilactobacillus sp.]
MINSPARYHYPLIQNELNTVNQILQTHINAANPRLQAALIAMANHGGKYLRPALLLMVSKAIGSSERHTHQLTQLAASIEILHMASLIHDDIIDDSPMRRGQVSIQSRFGKDTAVYAGDYLFTIFFDLLITNLHDDNQYLQVNATIMQRLLNGELGQMARRFDTTQTIHQYLRNVNGKTAALFQLAAREGAHFAGANASQTVHAAKFGQNLGIAFQMLDDILDYTGTSQLTKPTMEDLSTGVYSLPMLFALQDPRTQASLKPLLTKKYQLTMNDMQKIKQMIINSNALVQSQRLATKFTNRALDHLQYLPDSPARDQLDRLAKQLLKRVN